MIQTFRPVRRHFKCRARHEIMGTQSSRSSTKKRQHTGTKVSSLIPELSGPCVLALVRKKGEFTLVAM